MAKVLNLMLSSCRSCPYNVYDNSYHGYRCRRSDEIIVSEWMTVENGWPPIPDWCSLPDKKE